MLQLRKHGAAIGNAYQTTISSGVFINYIPERLENSLNVLVDQSTD